MRFERVNIGLEIEKRMNELGLNKSQLAKKIGISNQYINRLFEKSGIDTDKLVHICEVLDCDFFSLYRPIGAPDAGSAVASGDSSVAAVNSSVTVGDTAVLEERVKSLQRLLEEKERTIQILMQQYKDE